MKTAKDISLIGIFTALLIGGQFALNFISGVEIVTVLLLSFAYYFGWQRSFLAVNAFSFLRCFIFGFFPNVMILYFVYYNLFVAVFSLLGLKFGKTITTKSHVILIITAVLMTVSFTVFDNIITPVYYKFSLETTKAYWITSLTAVVPQVICTLITVLILLPVLIKIYKSTGLK